MKSLRKYIPKVQKKTLLLIAGMVWGFAGFKVLSLGVQDLLSTDDKFIFNLIFAALVFYIFFKFIFSKIFNKHIKRIINSQLEKHCIFSFFDIKSYCIMGAMIFLGRTIRNLGIFNPIYVGNFYIGLGFALFLAGVLFIMSSLKFELTKLKYNN